MCAQEGKVFDKPFSSSVLASKEHNFQKEHEKKKKKHRHRFVGTSKNLAWILLLLDWRTPEMSHANIRFWPSWLGFPDNSEFQASHKS